jgi:hypothetical protein
MTRGIVLNKVSEAIDRLRDEVGWRGRAIHNLRSMRDGMVRVHEPYDTCYRVHDDVVEYWHEVDCVWRTAVTDVKFFGTNDWKDAYVEEGSTTPEKTFDEVECPAHYLQDRTIEPIDVIEDWRLPFHLGNAVKYIARAGRKDDVVVDLKKACWYLARYLTLKGGKK